MMPSLSLTEITRDTVSRRGISSGSGLGVGGASDRVSDLMAKAAFRA